MRRLIDILSLRRPHGSEGEMTLINDHILPLYPDILTDYAGHSLAYVVEVGNGSKTLFSCHVDTADFWVPVQHTIQRRRIVSHSNGAVVAKNDLLGADDGAGVWLMLEMIDNQIPGAYVFHRGEEVGGIGSSVIAFMYTEFLRRFDRVIAFDRRGTNSVVTHQCGQRCCSDSFAVALCRQLSDRKYRLKPDVTGIFTDTANYVDFVPECTNISVGYFNEHTTNERLDLRYLGWLRNRCLEIDWEALPTDRRID